MTSSCHFRVACTERHGVTERRREGTSASLFHAEEKAISPLAAFFHLRKLEGKARQFHLHAPAITQRLISRVFKYDGI